VNNLIHTPAAASLHGIKQMPFTNRQFLHLAQKFGEKFTCYAKLTAEHEVDRWTTRMESFEWQGATPVAPIASFPAGCLAINTPEGEAAVAKMKAEIAAVNKFRQDTNTRLANENKAFAASVSKWLTASTPFSGLYQESPFGRPQVSSISVQFANYDPVALTFTGQVTFLGYVGVMSFKGSVQDCTLNLHDMEVVKGQISADPAWVLKLASNGDLQGFYPTTTRGDQPVIIHPK
jgi:hypothetical protein